MSAIIKSLPLSEACQPISSSIGFVEAMQALWRKGSMTSGIRGLLCLTALGYAVEFIASGVVVAWIGPAYPAAFWTMVFAARFAVTLLPGREPLISRYSRYDSSRDPEAQASYTRGLTALWAILLTGFAALYVIAGLRAWSVGPMALAQLFFCMGFFLAEHLERNRRFPEDGRATPLRTIRAIRRAEAAVS